MGQARMRRTALAAAAGALLLTASPGAIAGAAPGQAPPGPLAYVAPAAGMAGEPFTVSGTGCAEGIVTLRLDGELQFPYPGGNAAGEWSATRPFPAAVGTHTLAIDCSDQSTAGAPTTMYGPGDLRFSYSDIEIETLAPIVTEPSTPAVTPPVTTPPAPTPAVPTAAAPDYTG